MTPSPTSIKRGLLWLGLFLAGAVVGFEIAWLASVGQRDRPAQSNSDSGSRGAVTISISATIDGSDRFIFTRDMAYDEHMGWGPPRNVVFNGQPWQDLSQPPPGWAELGPNLDLTKAVIATRKGRDLIALEPTPEGFDLYFADTPMGAGPYEVTLSIPRK